MLIELKVKNYALIRDLVFKPGDGFNVITGETGAGKSILLGALGLVLGERADSVAVKENEEKCVVEAVFNVNNPALNTWLNENEFDAGSELILRREIMISGKSRAFINDTPAQLSQLKEIGKFLIDIHSQHDNLDLFQKAFQFKVLDAYAGSEALMLEYKTNYDYLKSVRKKIAALEEDAQKNIEANEYKQFLLDELLALNPVDGEIPLLEAEMQALSSAEENLGLLASVYNQLNESENSTVDQLAIIRSQIQAVAKNDSKFAELAQRMDELYLTLKEMAIELEQLSGHIQQDPERLEVLNNRLSALHNLSRKHRTEDLKSKIFELEDELALFSNITDEIEALKVESLKVEHQCQSLGKEISELRLKHAPALEKEINVAIKDLGMPGASIKVEVLTSDTSQLGVYGFNDANLLYAPAEGKSYNPIQNIASGGEISRVMLVLKSILARKNVLPTIIFDEIDTGISGEVAIKMGTMLNDMSSSQQLIAITHLPQIASQGKSHFYVFKQQTENGVSSAIRILDSEARIAEIAEMIGGKSFSNSTLESAKQMLKY